MATTSTLNCLVFTTYLWVFYYCCRSCINEHHRNVNSFAAEDQPSKIVCVCDNDDCDNTVFLGAEQSDEALINIVAYIMPGCKNKSTTTNGSSDVNGVKDVQNNTANLINEEEFENDASDLNRMIEIHSNNLELEDTGLLPKVCMQSVIMVKEAGLFVSIFQSICPNSWLEL